MVIRGWMKTKDREKWSNNLFASEISVWMLHYLMPQFLVRSETLTLASIRDSGGSTGKASTSYANSQGAWGWSKEVMLLWYMRTTSGVFLERSWLGSWNTLWLVLKEWMWQWPQTIHSKLISVQGRRIGIPYQHSISPNIAMSGSLRKAGRITVWLGFYSNYFCPWLNWDLIVYPQMYVSHICRKIFYAVIIVI